MERGPHWLSELAKSKAARREDWPCCDMTHVRLPASMSDGQVPFHARIPTGFHAASAPISRA